MLWRAKLAGQASGRPVGGIGRRGLKGGDQDPLDLLVADPAWRTRPWLIGQSVSSRSATNRACHLVTVDRATPNCRATWLFEVPSAQASTILQRNANAWALLGRLAQRCSVDRSWADSTNGASHWPPRSAALKVIADSMAGTYQPDHELATQDTSLPRSVGLGPASSPPPFGAHAQGIQADTRPVDTVCTAEFVEQRGV